ncbi:interleukin-13 receptor subunit alpha-1 precursor [Salmo salar]|uniref:Interleukin-13 receptor alpha-2 chain n=1 Tax=Salmo salar TaxID=8030 RepID=B5X2U2_SALSA|nr:interleukin-13 receptor subunit alpha-1 precursor [Salmo salar]ACI33623.1 Interleukin-13 receptor alpha-2 chain precursor [Salmo salar]|eukprot:NP_001133641.1 Interleukin-13 receptor alpha-2 chain precursor [Salmo salar]
MILKHLAFLLVLRYFINLVALEVAAEKALSEPLNLSLTWESEFRIKLSWNAPEDLDASCKVNYMIVTRIGEEKAPLTTTFNLYKEYNVTNDAVNYTVKTNPRDCTGRTISRPVSIFKPKPTELVKNFHCSLYSSKAMNCSWLPVNQASDLQLYYGYLDPSHIAACSEYQYRDDQRTGCHLKGSFLQYDVYFKVNGTLDGLTVQNNFLVVPRYYVKPPAPKVKITEEGQNLILSWDPPDIGAVHCWEFVLNYDKCKESVNKEIQSEHVPVKISYDKRCQYRVKLKAVYAKWCGEGGSDWSEEEIYGVDDWSTIVFDVVIPAVVFLFLILFICCFMKHREKLFPTIPHPSLIFKDMLNSNKELKSSIGNLYVPVEEEVECKISLEKDYTLPMMQPDH